jgi:hypothetical protein
MKRIDGSFDAAFQVPSSKFQVPSSELRVASSAFKNARSHMHFFTHPEPESRNMEQYSLNDELLLSYGCGNSMPAAFSRMEYRRVLAVMNSVFMSPPPKETFDGVSGTATAVRNAPSALKI